MGCMKTFREILLQMKDTSMETGFYKISNLKTCCFKSGISTLKNYLKVSNYLCRKCTPLIQNCFPLYFQNKDFSKAYSFAKHQSYTFKGKFERYRNCKIFAVSADTQVEKLQMFLKAQSNRKFAYKYSTLKQQIHSFTTWITLVLHAYTLPSSDILKHLADKVED